MRTDIAGECVWYVAFGSNLDGARLQRYLDRAPHSGPPVRWAAVTLPHRLFFAHESSVWTGGTAFIDPQVTHERPSFARAWLVTRAQFSSVVAQENRRQRLDCDGVWELAAPGQTCVVDDRRYGLALRVPSPDHRPAFTFTTPADPLPGHNDPSDEYRGTIERGLVDAHGLTRWAARSHVERALEESRRRC